MKVKVSAIIPAFNEEKKILGVINSLLKSPLIEEIIVVNDGSTDRTSSIVRSVPRIKLIDNKKNRGKGFAIGCGIEQARGEIVLFVDADIYGLTQKSIESLILPLLLKNSDLTIGYRSSTVEKSVGVPFSGERAYFKRDLLPLTKTIKKKAYAALELYLNYHFKNKRKKIVHLKGVYSTPKHEKYSYQLATKLYLHETYKMASEILSQKNLFSFFAKSYLSYIYLNDRRLGEYVRFRRYFKLPL